MNFLIAKTGDVSNPYVLVSSDLDVYTLPIDLSDSVEYSPNTLLGNGQWYKIEEFKSKEFCINLLSGDFSSSSYNEISAGDYSCLDYLCSYQDDRYFFFQKIYRRGIIKKKWFSISNPTFISDDTILVINDVPDAIFDKINDILYFRDLSKISSIFNGINSLYREATQEEVDEFLQNTIIQLGGKFSFDKVGVANRKRIALLSDSFSGMTPVQMQSMATYIRNYCDELVFDATSNAFVISNDTELKYFLYGIDERFYTANNSGKKRLANSIVDIN